MWVVEHWVQAQSRSSHWLCVCYMWNVHEEKKFGSFHLNSFLVAVFLDAGLNGHLCIGCAGSPSKCKGRYLSRTIARFYCHSHEIVVEFSLRMESFYENICHRKSEAEIKRNKMEHLIFSCLMSMYFHITKPLYAFIDRQGWIVHNIALSEIFSLHKFLGNFHVSLSE